MKRLFAFLALVSLSLLLSACGGGTAPSSNNSPAVPTIAPTATPSPTPTPQPVKTAEQLLQALKQKGLPIGESFVYDENNDSNHLLGRPGQYTSKVNFKDTRLTSTSKGADIAVKDGGSVELFANADDAQKRFTYIQAISKSGNALFAEYEYIDKNAILRVSIMLTPSQAKVYEDALKQVMA